MRLTHTEKQAKRKELKLKGFTPKQVEEELSKIIKNMEETKLEEQVETPVEEVPVEPVEEAPVEEPEVPVEEPKTDA